MAHMNAKPIAQALQEWADEQLHADFIFHANMIIKRYQDHAPRIDTGEWWVDCEREINAYREVFSEEAGVQLHPLRLEDSNGRPTPVIAPATDGKEGDKQCLTR